MKVLNTQLLTVWWSAWWGSPSASLEQRSLGSPPRSRSSSCDRFANEWSGSWWKAQVQVQKWGPPVPGSDPGAACSKVKGNPGRERFQVIAGVLEQSWEPTNIYLSIKEAHLLPQMAAHIDKIISDFWSDPPSLSFCFVIILQPLTIWSQIFSGGLMAQSILSYSWYMTTYTLNLYSTFQY